MYDLCSSQEFNLWRVDEENIQVFLKDLYGFEYLDIDPCIFVDVFDL